MKAKAGHIGNASNLLSFIGCSQCMRSILNNQKIMLMCNLQNGIHITWLPGIMYRNNCFCPGSNLFLQLLWRNIVCIRVNVCKYRRSTTIKHTVCRRRKSNRRRDHLIPLTNSCCQTRHMKRRCSIAYCYSVLRPHIICHFLFKSRHCRSCCQIIRL